MALTNYSLTPAASATNRYTASAYYATAWAAYNDALDCIGLLLFHANCIGLIQRRFLIALIFNK